LLDHTSVGVANDWFCLKLSSEPAAGQLLP